MKKTSTIYALFLSFLLILVVLTGKSRGEHDSFNSKLKLSGFSQFEYLTYQKDSNSFRARRIRFKLKGEILKTLDLNLQVDPTQNPALIDLHLDFKLTNNIRIRTGQFKIPFSLENLTSSSSLDTVNYSKTVEYLCPGRDNKAKGRDVGLSFMGRLTGIEFTFGVLNGAGINRMDNDKYKDIAARLVFSPSTRLSLGSSQYWGKSISSTGSYENKTRTELDIVFTEKKFNLKGEMIFGRNGSIKKQGAYIQGAYFLFPEKIQILSRFDSVDLNKDFTGDRIQVLTLGLNWFIEKKTKFIFNYEFHREEKIQSANDVFIIQLQVGY